MTRFFLLLVFAIFGTTSALAERLAVRSGEHPNFTRLVMKLPTGVEWSFRTGTSEAELQFALPDLEFDITGVFTRIPRDRLADLKQDTPGDPLRLSFGCFCEAKAFVEAGNYLVVDIRKSTASGPIALKRPVLPNLSGVLGADASPKIKIETAPPISLPLDLPRRGTQNDLAQILPDQRQMEFRLLTQLTRAVDQDILDIAPDVVAIETDSPKTAENPILSDTLGINENIRIATVIDRDLYGLSNHMSTGSPKRTCSAIDDLKLAQWGEPGGFADHIGDLRNRVVTEAGDVDPEVVLELAQQYIYFGFGTEALSTLSLHPDPSQISWELPILAGLLDSGAAASSEELSGFQHCDGPISLWSVLTQEDLAQDANTQAITNAFSKLPEHLQFQLGPRLGMILTRAGDKVSTRAVLRILNRSLPSPKPEVSLIEAEVARLEGDHEEYQEKLEAVVEDTSDSEQAPRALIALLEDRWHLRQGFSEADTELLSAHVHEFRKSELGADLQRAYILALALNGQFDDGFSELGELAASQRPASLNRILTLLVERADDVSFLKLALEHGNQRPGTLARETVDLIAERLIDLGFYKQAMDLLDDPLKGRVAQNRKFLLARAALGLNLPHRAQLELLGTKGPEGARLRAKALEQKGELTAAAEQLVQSGQLDEAARALWLTEDWEQMPNVESEYTRAAELSIDLRPPETTEIPNRLSEARNLISESESARAAISELLEAIN
ncbi:hypothetical protein [Tropicibacter sp. Alg240-R139]|uniref:hypothetical protein n=1 Tax=Tropicibacter sp. Alg240-R139 TaxID=2305991 RepID=UPI0013E08458|nr:hypothetical protein [Tropicibacter sp. Alg240-R139]